MDLSLPPAGAAAATVYGVVTDGTAPIADATVKLFDSTGMSTIADTRTYNGTVSGIIRNTSGQAVTGCFVGLYQVTTVGGITQETLVATTKTNSTGNYLFGGVIGGEYLVKAKLEQ